MISTEKLCKLGISYKIKIFPNFFNEKPIIYCNFTNIFLKNY